MNSQALLSVLQQPLILRVLCSEALGPYETPRRDPKSFRKGPVGLFPDPVGLEDGQNPFIWIAKAFGATQQPIA